MVWPGSKAKGGNSMQIVVLTGSPRRNGNSSYLADRFVAGAEEAGHSVFRFDAAFKKVNPCIACNHCRTAGACVYDDDFTKELKQRLIDADMVVFCSPMYYFGLSSQLKTVIDRFYGINGAIKGVPKRTALLMTNANTSSEDSEAMVGHYKTIAKYLGWKDLGVVVATGVVASGDIRSTRYGDEAYRLGRECK